MTTTFSDGQVLYAVDMNTLETAVAAAQTAAAAAQAAAASAANSVTVANAAVASAVASANAAASAAAAAQATANAAVPKAGGAMTGALVSAPTGTTAAAIYGGIGTTGFTDQMQGVAVLATGTPSTFNQATAVAGYVSNRAAQNTAAGQPNAVAVFGCGTAEVDYAATWGLNMVLQDNASRAGVSTGQGRQLLNELDFTVTCSNTVISGLNFTGSSTIRPKSATAVSVLPHGDVANNINISWDQALWSTDGAASYITVAGLQATALTANAPSQPHLSFYGDHAGTRQTATTYVEGNPNGTGGIYVISGGALPCALQLSGFVQVGGQGLYFSGVNQVVGPRVAGWGTPVAGTRGFLPGTATLAQVINMLNALAGDMNTHGLIGT